MIIYVVSFLLCLINTFTILNVILISKYLFGCDMTISHRTLFFTGGLFLVFDIILSVILSDRIPYLTTAIIYAYIVVTVLILTRTHRLKTVFLTIPAVLLYVEWCNIFALFEKLPGVDRYYYLYPNGNHITVFYCLTDITLFALLLLIRKFSEKYAFHVQLTLGEGITITILCIFLPIIEEIFILLEDYFHNVLYNTAWTLFLIALNFAIIYAIAHRKRAQYYKELSENYKEKFDMEYHRFKEYKEEQHDLVKFRHDFNSHMLLLQEMIANGNYEKAQNYFVALTESVPVRLRTVLTGNELIDLLLNARQDLFHTGNIDLCCRAPLTGLDFMNEVDCCILFSNLIDNAIEANMKIEDSRYIEFIKKQTSMTLYIEIRNPIREMPILENGQYISSKPGKGHGIGLQNVITIISKYRGTYQIEVKNDIFSVQILFPLPLIG
ncbi:MAG: GHKL domain-containing protein [Suilimivivens sp.]